MIILGISCFFHDAAAALLRDGELVAAAAEESFSRVKHDPHYPARAIEYCLKAAGVSARDLDYVVFYEKPFVKFERLITTLGRSAPRSWRVFPPAMRSWFGEKLWVRNSLLERLVIDPGRLLFVDHHLSHAASAFFCSPYPESAVLTVDGVGEWSTVSWGRGRSGADGSSLELEEEIRFPHSLGLLYSAFTAFLGFEVNEGEYKVMGMAAYGRPIYEDRVRRLIRLFTDGSFELDPDYFAYTYDDKCMYSRAFERLWGEPRDPKARFVTARTSLYDDPRPPKQGEIELNQRYADIAASLQKVLEEAMLGLARYVHGRTGQDRLCVAGGVAFNCLANRRLIQGSGFEDVFIQPAAGDAGGALGAALYAHHVLLRRPRRFAMTHAYWGPEHPARDIRDAIAAAGLRADELGEARLRERAVSALEDGKVIGWYRGRLEWGPRALGHRSILASPLHSGMKDKVNIKIKFREPYRPFAPTVPADEAARFFALEKADLPPYKFMLVTADVLEARRGTLPAVTHEDGTARLQRLDPGDEPAFEALLRGFGQATGVPVLLNTSFNLKGEPIVNTPAEAVSSYLRSGLDACALGDFWLQK